MMKVFNKNYTPLFSAANKSQLLLHNFLKYPQFYLSNRFNDEGEETNRAVFDDIKQR